MKHIKISILSSSPIVRVAIEAFISKLGYNTSVSTLERCSLSEISKIKPSILIADPILISISEIEAIRVDADSKIQIIAIYHTALPSEMIRAYDETISIYETEDTIREILMRVISSREEDDDMKALSQREKDVVVGIVKGLSNKEIAQEMNVSVNTVMTHRRNIVSKLQIHSPAGLTIYAIVSKLVRLDEIKSALPI